MLSGPARVGSRLYPRSRSPKVFAAGKPWLVREAAARRRGMTQSLVAAALLSFAVVCRAARAGEGE